MDEARSNSLIFWSFYIVNLPNIQLGIIPFADHYWHVHNYCLDSTDGRQENVGLMWE